MNYRKRNLLHMIERASLPSERFEKKLLENLTMYQIPAKKIRKGNMKNIWKFSAVAMMIAVIAISIVVLSPNDEPANNVAQIQDNSRGLDMVTTKINSTANSSGSAAGSSLPGGSETGQSFASLGSVIPEVEFDPVVIMSAYDNEQLAEIVINEGLVLPGQKVLYTSYAKDQKLYYQLIQSPTENPNNQAIPPEVKTVEITFLGRRVIASKNQFWDETTPAADVYPGTPRITLSWVYGGVAYDLSEYGDIDEVGLKMIIASMEKY